LISFLGKGQDSRRKTANPSGTSDPSRTCFGLGCLLAKQVRHNILKRNLIFRLAEFY